MNWKTPDTLVRWLAPVLLTSGCSSADPNGLGAAFTRCGDGQCLGPVEDCASCPEDCEQADALRVCTDDGIHAVSACGVFGRRIERCGPCGCSDSGGAPACVANCCGDGACDATREACDTCPSDCRATSIGSLACSGGAVRVVDACGEPAEIVRACGVCGCDPSTATCIERCCGDGECNGAESCDDCPQDCGGEVVARQCRGADSATVDACGRVLALEACGPCGCHETRCVSGCCGDGVCEGGESCATCPDDCAVKASTKACHEGRVVVLDDCGAPVEPLADCGACGCDDQTATCRTGCCDGICDSGEDCTSCLLDCGCGDGARCVAGGCVETCGDGTCDEDEDCDTCPDDCGCGPFESCSEGRCECVLPPEGIVGVTSCRDVSAFVSFGCDRCDEPCGGSGMPPGTIVWTPVQAAGPLEISIAYVDGYCGCRVMEIQEACQPNILVLDCAGQAERAAAVGRALEALADELDFDLPPSSGVGFIPDVSPCQ